MGFGNGAFQAARIAIDGVTIIENIVDGKIATSGNFAPLGVTALRLGSSENGRINYDSSNVLNFFNLNGPISLQATAGNPINFKVEGVNNVYGAFTGTNATNGAAGTWIMYGIAANNISHPAITINYPTVKINATLQIPAGAGAGLVLSSDASGNAAWAALLSNARTMTSAGSTITVSQVLTNINVDINLANHNTWTGQQDFGIAMPEYVVFDTQVAAIQHLAFPLIDYGIDGEFHIRGATDNTTLVPIVLAPNFTIGPNNLQVWIGGSLAGKNGSIFSIDNGTTTALSVDVSTGAVTAAKLHAVNGANGTINLAKLTLGGSVGTITVVDGIITAFTNPT